MNQKRRKHNQDVREKQYQALEEHHQKLMRESKIFTLSKVTLAVRAAIRSMAQ